MFDNLRLLPETYLKPIGKTDFSSRPRNVFIPGVFFRGSVVIVCTASVAGICLSYRNQYVTSFGGFLLQVVRYYIRGFQSIHGNRYVVIIYFNSIIFSFPFTTLSGPSYCSCKGPSIASWRKKTYCDDSNCSKMKIFFSP